MRNQLSSYILWLIAISAGVCYGQQIELKVGSLTVDPASATVASCVQIPILINDPMSGRDLRDMTFTVEFSGDTGIIDGGIAVNMVVANAFSGAPQTGLSNPGTDLDNINPAPGPGSPSCSAIFNQATEGSGAPIDFLQGTGAASWFINNNQGAIGRKQGFVIDPFANGSISSSVAGDQLIAVLEIPIIANPGVAQLLITATPNGVVTDANVFTWDDGTDSDGKRVQISESLSLPVAPAVVNFFDVVDCAGATASPDPATWADPNDGGLGGVLFFSFPGTSLVDHVHLTGSGGLDLTIGSGGATTAVAIDTTTDSSPDPATNPNTYTAVYNVEFPPASGTFVSGAPCNINVPWAAPSCTVAFTNTPVVGMSTDINVTLVNAQWDGARYGVLDANGMMVDLVVPSAGAGTNTLQFNGVFPIAAVAPGDAGIYQVTGSGPGGPFNCSVNLVLDPPVNMTNCATITTAVIGGSVDIDLQGNAGTIDFTVIYNGTTYDNLPAGVFSLPNISSNAPTIEIRANGFDAMGNPIFDSIICNLNFAAATCFATQNPDSTVTPVDVGTVITLTLTTTGAVSATANGVPMSVVAGTPGVTDMVTWEATHVAVADTIISGVATNPDAMTVQCDWAIDINCIDPSIVSVAQVGDVGVTIAGTFGCTYTVRITQHNSGTSSDYDVSIDTLIDPLLNTGTGTLNVVVPPDSWIEVGQQGFPTATAMVHTVPTLGIWALIGFVILLMASALYFMRRPSLSK